MSLFGGVKWTTLSTIVRSAVRIFQVAILTRILPKEAFGTIAIAGVFIGFTDIFMDLGISSAILHKQEISKNEYSSLFWLNVFSGLGIMLILWGASPLIAYSYKDDSLSPIIQLLSINVLFSSFGRQHRTVLQKHQHFKVMAYIEMAVTLLTLTVAVTTAYIGLGVYSLVASSLCSAFVMNSSFLVYGLSNGGKVLWHFRLKDTYCFLKIGVFQIGSSVLDFFSRELDTLIVSYTMGRETLGVYSLCKHIILTLYHTVNPILMRVLTPIFATMQNDRKMLKTKYAKTVSFLATTNMPLYTMIAMASTTILHYIYGSNYTEGNIVMGCFALSYGILSINNPVGSLQVSLGRTDIGFYWTLYRIITNSLVVFVGALFSIEALAVAFLIYTSINIMPLWRIQLKPMLDISFTDYLSLFSRQFIFATICAIPYFALFFYQVNLLQVITYSIIYLLSYLMMIKRFDNKNLILSLIDEYIFRK